MRLFRIGTTDVKVNLLFLAMLAFAALTGFWREAMIVVGVVALHESAHAVVAKALGVDVLAIELLPFGAVARLSGAPMRMSSEIFSALAGPAVNIVALMIAASLEKAFPRTFSLDPLFVRYSIALAVFNLLPALPLDGGRILRAMLTARVGQLRATKIACIAGYILAGLLVAGGIWLWITDHSINYTLFIISAFIALSVARESQTLIYRMARDTLSKSDRLSRDGILPVRTVAVYYGSSLSKLLDMRAPGAFTIFNVVDDNLTVLGSISEGELLAHAAARIRTAGEALHAS